MKHPAKTDSGMTLMELMATVVVVSILTIGLGLTTRTIQDHYARDTVKGDVRQYGNMVMKEILHDISLANRMDISSMNGFSRITIFKLDENNQPVRTSVSAFVTQGLKINNRDPLNGQLHFPDGGRFKHLQTILLTDFSVREIPVIRPSLAKFASSTYDITLEITIKPKYEGREKIDSEVLRFKRRIFMPMKYVTQNNNSVQNLL
ncbi:MAG: Tfp pilus assembly protein FimT/FimU [Fidelibacterota bacterium]